MNGWTESIGGIHKNDKTDVLIGKNAPFPLRPSQIPQYWSGEFYIHGSVHHNSILIRSNKMQQQAGVYLLWDHSTCFGYPSHPSSGVHKTVTAASGTGHSI